MSSQMEIMFGEAYFEAGEETVLISVDTNLIKERISLINAN